MRNLLITAACLLVMAACKSNADTSIGSSSGTAPVKDTFTYAYKATYSSDMTVPSHPDYAQTVLKIWKLFEANQVDMIKPYFADTVTYEDSKGMRYHGTSDGILALAKEDNATLDSLRFDISIWQSVHVNDKNEDWIQIWARERQYPKKGVPDSFLTQENWKIKDGKVIYFNQYTAKLPKG